MKQNPSKLTDVLTLLTVTVLALCMLLVLLSGAGVYRNLVDSAREQYARRTAVRYLTTRVRQAEAVAVEDFQGCCALVIREETDGEAYLTRVYCHDGAIRELYSPETARLAPADGEMIVEAEELSFEQTGNLLTVCLGAERLMLYLPAGEEGLP